MMIINAYVSEEILVLTYLMNKSKLFQQKKPSLHKAAEPTAYSSVTVCVAAQLI